MKVLELLLRLLTHSGAEASTLVPVLRSIADNVPDLAPEAEEWIGQIEAGVTPEGIASLAKTALGEIIGFKGLDPRDHAANVI